MKFIKYTLIFSLLIFPTISYSKTGKGELKLSKEIMEYVMMYMYGAGSKKFSADKKTKNDPSLMAVSEDGNSAYYFYCPAEYRAYGCIDNHTTNKAKRLCEKYSNGVPCFTFAKKRIIVWKNGGKKIKISRSDLKDPYLVAKKIQDGGFYDGDLSNLPGINLETGHIDNEKKNTITKQIDNTANNSTNNTNSNNFIKEIKQLNELYKQGVLTKEEFTKAKNKILNNN